MGLLVCLSGLFACGDNDPPVAPEPRPTVLRPSGEPYYGFATPIEWVIGERSTGPLAKPAATWGDYRITPLELVRFSTGQARWPGALPAVLTQDRQVSFEAGRPLAVALMLGELTHGGIGTISYVDGNRVYGFGHPMFQFGQVELPIIEARVLGEVSNSWAPYKLAS